MTSILLIEDDTRSAMSWERLLKSQGYDVTLSHRGDEGYELAAREDFAVVITDLRLPGRGGLELVKELHAVKPRLPIVLMTAYGTTETAIEATKHGAFEYIVKPFEVPEMLEIVKRAVASSRLMTEPVNLGEDKTSGTAIVGRSRVMQTLYKEIGRVAATPATVLIRGETGTGKELVARAIYQYSERAKSPFIAVNCAAIPENLLESELFGHEKGAFTGADQRRIGRFEQAHEGTIFLDEIGDMTAFTQAKLLRVLQDRTIQRVGGKETIPVDVRVIAATHRDLDQLIMEKSFREDLYYRLSSVVIRLPPLRQHAEDIPDLPRYFLRRFSTQLKLESASIQAEAIEWLQQQSWPGNVRQLENVLRQGLLAGRGFAITREHLEEVSTKPAPLVPAYAAATADGSLEGLMDQLLQQAKAGADLDVHARIVEAMERRLFTQAYELARGNQALASRWLKVSRQTMREKLQQFGVREPGDENKT